mgnify:CR=1 FL=1
MAIAVHDSEILAGVELERLRLETDPTVARRAEANDRAGDQLGELDGLSRMRRKRKRRADLKRTPQDVARRFLARLRLPVVDLARAADDDLPRSARDHVGALATLGAAERADLTGPAGLDPGGPDAQDLTANGVDRLVLSLGELGSSRMCQSGASKSERVEQQAVELQLDHRSTTTCTTRAREGRRDSRHELRVPSN